MKPPKKPRSAISMKCHRCPEPATIVLVTRKDGKEYDLHLCRKCAQEIGLPRPGPEGEPGPVDWPAFQEQVDALIASQYGGARVEPADRPCPICGIEYLSFRDDGHLGCPHDYEAFSRHLVPLLSRSQGATRHVGKGPRRPRPEGPGLLQLRAKLRDAVAREDFEEAARLRDQLRDPAAPADTDRDPSP